MYLPRRSLSYQVCVHMAIVDSAQVMLKAIGVALRSVMFALLLLLGVVYVFAIASRPSPKGCC